jgi:hypothetical protein
MHGYAQQAGCDGHPLCFSISSKDLFDNKLNPGTCMTAQHAIFVKTIADAKAEMDSALAHGEVPALDDKKLELIMTHVRYHEQRQAAYQRDVVKFVSAVLAQKTLDQAATLVRKSFKWHEQYQPYGALVARAILQHETNRRTADEKFHADRLQAAKDIASEWGAKP